MSIYDLNILHNDGLDQYTFTCLNLKYEEEICILMTAVSFRSCYSLVPVYFYPAHPDSFSKTQNKVT